ncbi:MAG: hypothetical protein M1826_004670 [Phylliscum demangeonii]|nr:MAG: hypothetical protein M1826_004670 [Phylliscum demangeonii]
MDMSFALWGEIELDDDPSSISRMLTYLYTNNYEDAPGIEEKEPDSMVDLGEASIHFATSISDNNPREPDYILGVDDDPREPDYDDPPLDSAARLKIAQTVTGRALRDHALVYAVAEKYDIPALKDLAGKKFKLRSRDVWPIAGLQNVVRLVYQKTPDHDRALRTVIAELCAQHLPELISTDKFRSSVLKFSSFGLDMLQACVAEHEADKQDLWERRRR